MSKSNLARGEETAKLKIDEQIKMAALHAGVSLGELARHLDLSPQSLSSRLKTGKFTKYELEKIAAALGCEFICCFRFPDGKEY